MKYGQWLEEWLTVYVKPTVKARTFESYESIARQKIEPHLGERELDALTPTVLQTFAAELCERYAPNTVSCIVTVLRSSLKRARAAALVQTEYGGSICLPRSEAGRVACFTLSEQKKIERIVAGSRRPELFGIVLCLYTGLRIGELFALQWRDVDFVQRTLSVTKNCRDGWCQGVYRKIIGTPKTAASRRIVPIPRQLLQDLSRMRGAGEDYVISGANGERLTMRAYQMAFERLLKRAGIPHRGFHALRHTFATRALECGMDVKTLSEIMGHKNAALTLGRYTHSLSEHKRAMMDRVGRLWG